MISEAYEVIDLSDDEPSNDKHRRSPNMASTSNNNIVASSYETNFDDDIFADEPLPSSSAYECDENIIEGPQQPPKKRVKRSKEEINEDKLQKQLNKILREISASKRSKCEQYLFCHMDNSLVAIADDLKVVLQQLFTERNIQNQLLFESNTGNDMTIMWKRKNICAYIESNKIFNTYSMELQPVFCCILDLNSFKQLFKSKTLDNFIQTKISNFEHCSPQMKLVVFGGRLNDNECSEVVFELFEKYRLQIYYVSNSTELSYLIAQVHRSIAKTEKKKEQADNGISTLLLDKGVSDGPNITTDWWNRMLGQIHRIIEGQRRAIVEKYPNPFHLMDYLTASSPGEAMYELAQIKMETGRQIGPVFAQRIYKILTSSDGSEVIDNGNYSSQV